MGSRSMVESNDGAKEHLQSDRERVEEGAQNVRDDGRVSVDRAMDALEYAAVVAEKGALREGPLLGSRDAFLTLVRKDPRAVRSRLDRVMMGAEPELGLDALLLSGALEALMPEVSAMVGFGDGEWRHKDVWKHTKQVVFQATPLLEVRWAALLHDIGKVKTRTIDADGKVQFLGHAEVGARMFDRLERRVHLFSAREDEALKSTIRFLVLHHLRANQYSPTWTDSAVRRFARELGDHLDELICLSKADITTKRPEKKRKGIANLTELEERILRLRAEDAVQPALPSGIGDAIMAAFGLKPSKQVGEIKRALEAAVEAGEVEPHLPSDDYLAFLRTHAGRFGLPAV